MKKALIFLANGFEEIEALAVVDILRRANIDISMVSITGRKEVRGFYRTRVMADVLIEEVDFSTADMLILPGGLLGTVNLDSCTVLCNELKDFASKGKWVAAICGAPIILARLGILEGKKAACYPDVESYMEGTEIRREKVVMDGNIITSRGPATAIDFALRLVEVFEGEVAAGAIKKALLVE